MRTLSIALFSLAAVFPPSAQPQTGASLPQPGTRQRSPSNSSDAAFQQAYQSAYEQFQAGHLQEAAPQLERLRALRPASFEVAEVLGLTYAAEGKQAQAITLLQGAARLQPSSVPAQNNLATALARSGDVAGASAAWQRALALAPQDYAANRNLARLHLQRNEIALARPLLQAAHNARPEAADTTYDLALADLLCAQPEAARTLATALLATADTGDLHALLGRIEEEQGQYVAAANQLATAVRLDGSEDHFFAWGSEMLAHRAYVPAIAIFQQATERFPASPRLWVGLGMALYSRGEYEPSIHALLTAADLNAADPRCYLFLSKAYLSAPSQAEKVIERFRTYAALKPNDARAQFYYAISLWKGRRSGEKEVDYPAVQALLLRSLALDDHDAEAHLQLGILYTDQHAYDKARPEFERAVALDPSLGDAHFRLGRILLRAGDKAAADTEFDRAKQLQTRHQAQVDKERSEVQQFVIATEQPAQPVLRP